MPLTTGMTLYFSFVAAVLGLCMGSFLGCLAYRTVRRESMTGRSKCGACGHTLAGRDLVPVFSYIALKGRCRYCGERIGRLCPVSELLCAAAYVLVFLRFGISLRMLEMLLLCSLLLAISLADLDDYLIPDGFIIAGIAIRVVFILISGDIIKTLLASLIGGLSISLPMLIIVLIMDRVLKKESMGGGDIKLLFMTGLYFNWKINVLAIILSCILGIVLALAMKMKNKQIPFGPAISAGTFLAALIGEPLLNWYASMF